MLKRKLIDRMFRFLCLLLTGIPISFLFVMLFSIFTNAYYGLQQTKIFLDLESANISQYDSRYQIKEKLVKYVLLQTKTIVPNLQVDTAMKFFSNYAVHEIISAVNQNQKTLWVTLSGEVDAIYKHNRYKDTCLADLVLHFKNNKVLKIFFNYKALINGDSRDSTQAGILGAFVGSVCTMLVALFTSLPLGIFTALCLEEFMVRNKFTDFFEVSISNLFSTPPIIFGILGLAFYINFLGVPRSSSFAGGLTLAFMMFPILVISTRQSIKSTPLPIRQAAFALGASKMQVITHHILPLSMPGIVTGTILSIARILGESAPLLMIGMVAFVSNIPANPLDPATVFALQTYIWATNPDTAFIEKTSMIILILLIVLLALNCIAYFIKKSFHVEFQ